MACRMRRRRPVQPPPPGFALALPRDGQGCEVQVRPQTEHDRFLIETDDAMVSPMIMSNPVFQQQQQQQQQQCNSSSSSSSHAALQQQAQAPQTNSSSSSGGGGGGNAAKFIHLNNTNLFVLMDGVSMFFEGKSTFTGNDDALQLQQQLQSRRKAATDVSNDNDDDRGGGGGGGGSRSRRDGKARARTHGGSNRNAAVTARTSQQDGGLTTTTTTRTTTASACDGEGSVEDVIRDIEQNDAATTTTTTSSAVTTTTTTSSDGSSRPPATAVHVPDAFAALFAHATRPTTTPLFGRGAATRAAAAVAAARKSRAGDAQQLQQGRDGDAQAQHSVATTTMPATTSTTSAATTTATSADSGRACDRPRATQHGNGASDSHTTRRNGVAATTTTTTTTTTTQERLRKPLSVHDIGSSNRSLDLNDVEVLNYIGGGSQGKVYRVRLDGKLYALKCMDVAAAMQATNAVERQGRKRGLVKELNMICMQRGKAAPPKYLMQMFNAVVSLVGTRKQLSVLSELMSFSVEDAQCMVARIPPNELAKIAQAVFGDVLQLKSNNNNNSHAHYYSHTHHHNGSHNNNNNYSSNSNSHYGMAEERRLWHELGSCMHLLGRSAYDAPEEWEKRVDRQTPLPEVVLSMLAADVLRGLKELHEEYDTVHCDLKPGNVLLNFERMRFKLADFGCGCTMDAATRLVHRTGVDLGSKLYKAPERLSDSVADIPTAHTLQPPAAAAATAATSSSSPASTADATEQTTVVTFTAKADVWSLGIMLLELSAGVHPCSLFKSNYWNYINLLKLPKMVKPLTWSFAFVDFVVRCVRVDVATRWSVDALLQHPFIRKYDTVPRSKLKRFMEQLQNESATFQRKQQIALLQKQILLSTAKQAKDNYQKQSRNKWRTFTVFLKEAPAIQDTVKFPPLLP